MNLVRVLHRTERGLFTLDLFPTSKQLLVSLAGSAPGCWPIDISNRTEGTFQPLTMLEGSPGQIYVSGRIEESGEAAVYRFTFAWTGSEPVLAAELIYQGKEMGDITAIANICDLNGCLALLDFTNASLNYLNIVDGGVTPLVAYDDAHPEMLHARGMIARLLPEDARSGLPPGLHFTLQREQSVSILAPVGFSLAVVDLAFDGTLDDYYIQ